MAPFIPDRLITMGWYGTRESADEDKSKLDAAGVNAYVDAPHSGGYVELRVPEASLQRARDVLGITQEDLAEESAGTEDTGPKCPECGSDQVRKLPPYAG